MHIANQAVEPKPYIGILVWNPSFHLKPMLSFLIGLGMLLSPLMPRSWAKFSSLHLLLAIAGGGSQTFLLIVLSHRHLCLVIFSTLLHFSILLLIFIAVTLSTFTVHFHFFPYPLRELLLWVDPFLHYPMVTLLLFHTWNGITSMHYL